jgi:hypothetical protein
VALGFEVAQQELCLSSWQFCHSPSHHCFLVQWIVDELFSQVFGEYLERYFFLPSCLTPKVPSLECIYKAEA